MKKMNYWGMAGITVDICQSLVLTPYYMYHTY